MSQKKNKQKERQTRLTDGQIGKPNEQKKHLIDPKYKNSIWTIIIIVILLIFFIINNTRKTPAQGPYPPNYDKKAVQERLQR